MQQNQIDVCFLKTWQELYVIQLDHRQLSQRFKWGDKQATKGLIIIIRL